MAQTTKKPAAKKKTTVTKKPSQKSATEMQSFKRADNDAFMTFTFTRQTLYWVIIAIMVVSLAAWVLYIQLQIIDIYNSIEVNNALE
ncbi:MAG TPA: hypothetical protein VNI82_00770 [Candidatus Nitrosotenuis sp.]|nr:hypothetical protein [Candidatus Nitrosotenuis sp.]